MKEKPKFTVGFPTTFTSITNAQRQEIDQVLQEASNTEELYPDMPVLAKIAGKKRWPARITQNLFRQFCEHHKKDDPGSLVGKFITRLSLTYPNAPSSKDTIYRHVKPILDELKKK